MKPRRLLKDDAVPTLFAYNKDKQPQKRKASEWREKARAKRQLCEEAAERHELVQNFEYECNTKETQTDAEEVSTMIDVGVQCNIIEWKEPSSSSESESELEDINENCENDLDYIECDRDEQDYPEDLQLEPSKPAFIVYWSSLIILLKHCLFPACILTTIITDIAYKGSQLIVKMKCQEGHITSWNSQPNCNHYSIGNLTSAASVLFSANTYQRLANFFELAGVQWLSKTSFYDIQRDILLGVVNRNYNEQSKKISDDMKKHGVYNLSGDGRCDSPGHNAKYLTYSFMDKITNRIFAFSLTQVTEAGNSNRMEKVGFKKALSTVKKEGIIPTQITTDRHTGIRKHLREEEPDIDHQFDVWHFVKNIKKRLRAAAKKASCKILEKWIKSIGNHLWWACATCEGDPEMLREKWVSVLFHIQNKHGWPGCKKFKKCAHPRLSKKEAKAKEWLSPKSEAFEALQSIVLDPKVLNDLNYLTKFCHTGVLEVYHALYNKWAPKRQHFSYRGMQARSQLAIMDFNQGSNLKQAKTKDGEDRYNVLSSKVTDNWTAKPIKEEKDRTYLHDMVRETIEVARENKVLQLPVIPDLPKNIAKKPKPDKKEVIKNQKSRFGNTK